MLHRCTLEGIMRTESPLYHGSGEKKGTGADTLDLSIKAKFFGAEGGAPMQVPILQGNTFKGIMRTIGAERIGRHIGGFALLDDYRLYFNGGSSQTTEKGGLIPGDIIGQREFRKQNPFVSLLGGQIKTPLAGHIHVSHAIPITEATKHLVPDYFLQEGIIPHQGSTLDICILTRRDRSMDPNFDACLFDTALLERDEELQRIYEGKKNGKAKAKAAETSAEAAAEDEPEEEDKKSIQMIRRFETIAAGTNMFHNIDFFHASEEEIGLAVEILKIFASQPYVGGRTATGFGKVGVKYHLIMGDDKFDNALTANANDGFVLNSDFLRTCHESFLTWLAGLTRETAGVFSQLSTPSTSKKAKKGKEEK